MSGWPMPCGKREGCAVSPALLRIGGVTDRAERELEEGCVSGEVTGSTFHGRT